MAAVVQNLKSSLFPICRPLIELKLSYFLVSSVWTSVFPYVVLISTQIISLKEIAIIHACVPISSILGPIITGFLGDKLGNYKVVLMLNLLLGAFIYLPVLWLQAEYNSIYSTLSNSSQNNFTNSSPYGGDDPFANENSAEFNFQPYIFPILLVVRLLGFFAFDCANAILDACALNMTKKHREDFSRQKMFTTFSMILMPLLCGPLIDVISKYRGFRDTSFAFYVNTLTTLLAIPVVYKLDVEVTKNKQSLLKTARRVVGMVDVNVFILVQIIVGMCWSWHKSFIAVFIVTELQASKTILGLAISISGIGTLIMYWFAKIIVGRLGAVSSVVLSLLVTAVRFVAYYFTTNQWIALVNEIFDGVGGFLAIVAGNYFCVACSPPGMLASLNGVIFAAVFGAGRALGLTVGSLLAAKYGLRFAYLSLGILAGGTGILYLIAYHLFLKNMERNRLITNAQTQQNHFTMEEESNPNNVKYKSTYSVACVEDIDDDLKV